MSQLGTSSVNMAALRQIYSSEATARTILDEFASFRHNRTITGLEQLLFRLANAGTPVPKAEAIDVLKKLDEFGCGDFITGRKGHPTRFVWRYPLSEIGKAAAGSAKASDPIRPLEAPEELDALDEPATPAAIIDHAFQLRPDLKVTVSLPADLTDREAYRLSEFLKTLPFEGAARALPGSERG